MIDFQPVQPYIITAVGQCPECGTHQTIARMTHTADMECQECGASMLKPT